MQPLQIDEPALVPPNDPTADDDPEAVQSPVSFETAAPEPVEGQAQVDEYVARYKKIAEAIRKDNANSFIALCQVVEEAKEKLSKDGFLSFC